MDMLLLNYQFCVRACIGVISDHSRSGVVYNFSPVCLFVCMSDCLSDENFRKH